MAKNYADLYGGGNAAIALEQKFFIKKETTRGTLIAPAGTDFLYTLNGGGVNYTQPVMTSPHRSGRHHTSVIKEKTTTEWSIPTYFNIDTTLGAGGAAEIDASMRVMFESLFGNETVSSGLIYNPTIPDTTFTILENGDQWAKQASGCYVESCNMSFPGDGQAQMEWSGRSKTALLIGIGKSIVDNNTGNDITVGSGEGKRFQVGGLVMIIEANGTTRSADTPDGTPRTITAITGDDITVSGAVLADADGSVTPIYLCYYEPTTPTAINDPQTGLVGSLAVVNLPTIDCMRSASLNITNNHESQDFCYGKDGLGDKIFVPGGRFTAEFSMELNLDHELVEFMNNIKEFEGEDITLILGSATGRHFKLELPKVIFPVPEIPVPETGSIPVTFTGNSYQTALDAEDEVTASFL